MRSSAIAEVLTFSKRSETLDQQGAKRFLSSERLFSLQRLFSLLSFFLSFRAIEDDVDYFRQNQVNDFINSRDTSDDSVLSETARVGHLECLKVILARCPQLLYLQNRDGFTALHWAAENNEQKVVQFLIGQAETRLFRMVDINGQSALQIAVQKEYLEIVKMLIEADLNYIFPADKKGETPLSISLQASSGKSADDVSVKIRKLLLKTQPGQSKEFSGDKEWTVLHHAASKGDLGAIQDIIHFRPECLELVDKNNQNFLHIAAKNGHGEILKHALQTKEMASDILNWKDDEGNTPLLIACQSGSNKDGALTLLYDPRVNKTAVNDDGKKASDLLTFDYDKKRAFGVDEKVFELSVSADRWGLYTRLVGRFGEIVDSNLPGYKIGPTAQALNYFLEVITEMRDATPASISEEQLSEWENMYTYFSSVGLQIDWFQKRVFQFRDWRQISLVENPQAERRP